jgi:hypothetical protein
MVDDNECVMMKQNTRMIDLSWGGCAPLMVLTAENHHTSEWIENPFEAANPNSNPNLNSIHPDPTIWTLSLRSNIPMNSLLSVKNWLFMEFS